MSKNKSIKFVITDIESLKIIKPTTIQGEGVVLNQNREISISLTNCHFFFPILSSLEIMTPSDYQSLAMRTKQTKFSNEELMINAALGLAGESTECVMADNKDLEKELGDLEWYIVLMGEACNISFNEIYTKSLQFKSDFIDKNNERLIITALITKSGEICDCIKKIHFQGHKPNEAEIKIKLLTLQSFINLLCLKKNIDIQDVWKTNIKKLVERYPDGFSPKSSEERKDEQI